MQTSHLVPEILWRKLRAGKAKLKPASPPTRDIQPPAARPVTVQRQSLAIVFCGPKQKLRLVTWLGRAW